MFVCIPVARRAEVCRTEIANSPYTRDRWIGENQDGPQQNQVQQKCAKWSFLAIFGDFGDPPKSGNFRKISLRFQSNLGPQKVGQPPLKNPGGPRLQPKIAHFSIFARTCTFCAFLGTFWAHFWPFLAIFHILDLGGTPPLLERKKTERKKNPYRVPLPRGSGEE